MKKKLMSIIVMAVMLITGCQNTEDEIVASVGEDKITKSEFEFYLTSVKQQMQGTELSTEEDWQTMEIDGKLAIDVAKEQALNIAFNNVAYIQIYEKMGYEIGNEEKAKIKETKESIVSQYEQNGGYNNFLKDAQITDEFVDMLCKSMYCSDQLYAEFTSQREVTDEEMDAFFEENSEDIGRYRTAKHVLILTQDSETNEEFDEEKKAEAKQKAEGIYKRALAGEDFDALVKEYSEDPGSMTNPDGYTFSDGEMVEEFEKCVDSLKPGEIGFTKTSYGYHIIKRLELNKDYFKDGASRSILVDAFNEYIEQKCAEFSIVLEEKDTIDNNK